MARRYVFADESGNLDFSPHTAAQGTSRYFVLTTLTCDSVEVGHDLLRLRRDLAWKGKGLETEFHATTDTQEVRDEVFQVLGRHDFRLDATILEKSKAQPKIRPTHDRFYQYAWFYHMKYVAPRIVRAGDEILVVGASFGTKKTRSAFRSAILDVMQQVSPGTPYRVASWNSKSDPCLQAADYCCWAIGRKWERGDARSHTLISSRIRSEFDVFARGTTHYY